MVRVDDTVKVHDKVLLIGDGISMTSIANDSEISIHQALVSITNRVPRIAYKKLLQKQKLNIKGSDFMDFILLIVGMDANAYYMARCYHEKYGKSSFNRKILFGLQV